MKYMVYEALKLQKRKYIWIVLAAVSALYIAVLLYTTIDYVPYSTDYESIQSAQQNVITRAQANLSGGIHSGVTAYEYAYQTKAVDVYQAMYEKLPVSHDAVVGWDIVLQNDFTHIFVCITILMFISELFIVERSSGFLQIMHTCKKGRLPASAAKLGLGGIISVLVGLLYLMITLIVIHFRVGFSSLSQPMQYAEAFSLYPYDHTVGEYLWIHIFISSVGYLLFGVITSLVASFMKHYSLSYLIGGAVYVILFAVNQTDIFGRNALRSILDPLSTMAVYPLTMRYRAVNIADDPFSLTVLLLIVYVSVSFLIGGVVLVVSSSRHTLAAVRPPITLPKLSFRLPSPKWHPHMNLLRFEMHKQICSPRTIWLLIGITVVKSVVSANQFAPNDMYDDIVYKQYAMQIEGRITDETYAFIEAENEYINSVLDRREEIDNRFASGTISIDDYQAYSDEYSYANNHREPLEKIRRHLSYLESVEESRGIEAAFFYDTGWSLLFNSGMDWVLYLLVLMIGAVSFAQEYDARSSSGRFAAILRTAKHGRCVTCKYKLLSAVTITATLNIIYQVIDWMFIFKNYYMPMPQATILSIQTFGDTAWNISLMLYMVMMALMRLVAVIILTLFTCVLSRLTKRAFIAITVSGVVTLLPAAIGAVGVAGVQKLDYTRFMSFTPMYIDASAAIFAVICMVVTMIGVVGIFFMERNQRARRTT